MILNTNNRSLLYIILVYCLIFLTNCDITEKYEEVDINSELSLQLFIDDFSSNEIVDNSINNRNIVNKEITLIGSDSTNSGNYFFNHNSGYISVPNLDLSQMNSISVNVWLRSYSGNEAGILYQSIIDPVFQLEDDREIKIGNSKLLIGESSDKDNQLNIKKSLLNGEWNMLTLVVDFINRNNEFSPYNIYINGVEVPNNDETKLFFDEGASALIFSNYYGFFDKLSIYSGKLDSEDVSDLYNDEKNDFNTPREFFFPVSDGMMMYVTFDDMQKLEIKENLNLATNIDFTFSEDTETGIGFSGSFNDSTTQISFEPPFLHIIDEFSISFWCKTMDTGNGLIIGQGSTPFSWVRFNDFTISTGASNTVLDSDLSDVVFDNEWHHVVVVQKKSTASFYKREIILFVDNEEIESKEISGGGINFSISSNIIIGGERIFGTPFYGGLLDNIRIYNRSLEREEVSIIYHQEAN